MLVSPGSARIVRLALTNFRSYRSVRFDSGNDVVVLLGPNGVGKTNLLEAISFLSAGRGLRRATLEQVACSAGDGSWAIAAEVVGALGLTTLGTGIDSPGLDGFKAALTRKCRIDGEPVGSASAFADHLRVVWLTPGMDGLFTAAAADRRRFLDRLVLAVDTQHSRRMGALERALRSRNRLLEQPQPDLHWLDAVERETAETAISVAAARTETVRRLSAKLAHDRQTQLDGDRSFPWAEIALDGGVENALSEAPATDVEDRYREALKRNRGRDAAAGRTLEGPHLTDLKVTYGPKGIPAADASTGEQKALLIGLVLAHAGLVTEMAGFAPVLLLDEVVAHLDPSRRTALYGWLTRLRAQVFLTGADPAAFGEIAGDAALYTVSPGQVARQ